MRRQRFQPGWDEERVREVLRHYDEQTDDEAVAEDEAALQDDAATVREHSSVPRSPRTVGES